jgi:Tfp pilus assembly protein PilN
VNSSYGLDLNFPHTLIGIKQTPGGTFEIFEPPKNISLEAAISLPESEVFSKMLIQDTRLSDNEIFKRLDAYFADFNKPLVIDFQRLEGNKIKVMAAPLEKTKKLCEQVSANIKICAIDNESYAIARALKKTGVVSEDDFGFFYTEHHKKKLSVFKNNHLIFYNETESTKDCPEIENLKIIALENKPYLLALGLALRENTDWNLHRGRAENAQLSHRQGFLFLTRSIIYSILFCVAAHFALTGLVFSQQKYNQLLEKDFEKTWAETSTIQSQKRQINTMQTQLLTLQALKNQQLPSLHLLNSLSHAMPDGVFLTQLSLQEKNIQISGRAVTQEQIDPLMKNLKNIPLIINSTLHDIQSDASEPPYHFSFTVSANLKEPV